MTRKVCTEVGINAEKILLGRDIEKLSDPQLVEAVDTADVFARLSPSHKQRAPARRSKPMANILKFS